MFGEPILTLIQPVVGVTYGPVGSSLYAENPLRDTVITWTLLSQLNPHCPCLNPDVTGVTKQTLVPSPGNDGLIILRGGKDVDSVF